MTGFLIRSNLGFLLQLCVVQCAGKNDFKCAYRQLTTQ
jgi:hypothetical protein